MNGGPRIRELDSAALHVTHGLNSVTIGMGVSVVSAFLLVAVLGVMNQELGGALDDLLRLGRDLDGLLRAMFAPILILAGVLLLVGPIGFVCRRAATFAAAHRFAAQHPSSAPPRTVREGLRRTPSDALESAGVFGVIASGLLFVVAGVLLIGAVVENPEDISNLTILLVSAAVAVLISIVATVRGRRGQPVEKQRALALQQQWQRPAKRAGRAERSLRIAYPRAAVPRILRGGSLWWLFGVFYLTVWLGVAVFIVGLWLRQPGRFSEPRVLDPFGEGAIDVFSGVGGFLIVASGIASVALWLALVVVGFAREEVMRRWLTRAGGVRIADPRQRAELLGLPLAGTMISLMLAGCAAVVLIVTGSAVSVGLPNLDARAAWLTGGSLLLVALVSGMLASRREMRLRMLVRDALMPGDVSGDDDALPAALAFSTPRRVQRTAVT
jgi:hypothetical protein